MSTLRYHKGYASAPTGHVHYREFGAGDPIVFVHMAPSSSLMFEAVYPIFAAAGFRCVGVDLPGYGMSDPPAFTPTIANYAEAVESVMDALALPSCALVGHHTGARTVCHIAVESPHRVTRLVFQGSGVFTPEEREKLLGTLRPNEPIELDGSHFAKAWQRRANATPGWTLPEPMHRAILTRFMAGDTAWHGHHAAFSYDLEPKLRAITQPTLLLTNTGDPIFAQAARARAIRPDFAYVELAGGTHDIIDEQPEAWAGAIITFLRG